MIRNIGYALISAAMLFGYSYAQDASPGGGGGKQTEATFYGQKIDSKRIVFVIDHSGSMAEPADWKPGDGNDVTTGGSGGGKSDGGGNAGGGGGG
ncbi:MAG: hypothetical protein A2W23_04720 [Planctomycetes bacterium RBG_16_43_13]|nr:MAG: hypothetical protein A2W23_04720 [Planctomycetes bacterium RBG_16_43_13]